jgi:hypothetical protein
MSKPDRACQIKVTLHGVKPAIWRRCVISEACDLHTLHGIIQDVMGWLDSHLYEFDVAGQRFCDPEREDDFECQEDVLSSHSATLAQFSLKPGSHLGYTYDFGDDWEHEIVVEELRRRKEGEILPTCLAGARNCPPEDCGGSHGYAEFLEAYLNPSHSEHHAMVEWAGSDFDPEEFDLQETNEILHTQYAKR